VNALHRDYPFLSIKIDRIFRMFKIDLRGSQLATSFDHIARSFGRGGVPDRHQLLDEY
jgi:hypothetical protein